MTPLPDALRRLFGRRREVKIPPEDLPSLGPLPGLTGVTAWLNTEPLTSDDLRGKVVLIDFWTYSCVNCLRTLPHVRAWHENYAARGLVIIGVHTPEFDFEKDERNVREALERFDISYPVALDNDFAVWKAFRNHYWPAHYFADRAGRLRYHHFGEGGYDHSEAVIRALLAEDGSAVPEPVSPSIPASPVEFDRIGTPETYLGFDRMEYLGSPQGVRAGVTKKFTSAKNPALNVFYLEGGWRIEGGYAESVGPDAAIIYRIKAAQVNLVMDGGGSPHRVTVEMDGRPLDEGTRGEDVTGEAGRSFIKVSTGRLYNLVDSPGDYRERLLRLTFNDPGVKTYAFTFG